METFENKTLQYNLSFILFWILHSWNACS